MSDDTMADLGVVAGNETAALPPLKLDVREYLPELAEFDLTEAEKIEFLETLWSLMLAFVELGFTTNICEQIFENAPPVLLGGPSGVNSAHHTTSMEKTPDGTERENA